MLLKIVIITFALICGQLQAATVRNEPIRSIPKAPTNDPKMVELGNRLFHDPRLSVDNTISCASCHSLTTGGVDRQTVSIGINGQKGSINSPTVFNSSLSIRQFWDGRARNLFEQADGPVNNPIEMGSNWPQVISKLKLDPNYVATFQQLFDNGINTTNIKTAIVAFENSLLTPNSRFDQYLLGNDEAITQEELRGYKLFKQYGCTSCHQGRAIGGNMFQKLGVMRVFFAEKEKQTKADLGRFNITGKEHDRFVFKVPTLRNIALTAPYLHDGSAKTLNDVVEIMMTYQLGAEPSTSDIRLIVQFLRTLTGEYQGALLQ
jgi:cytochrome c peroxidase